MRHTVDQDTKRSFSTEDTYPSVSSPPSTRHMPLPDIPRLSVFAFEAMMCLFSLIVLAAQYLNIYRTVFWLPHSHTRYAMNLYLIEPRVVVFIVVSVSRRLCWCVVKGILTSCLHHNLWKATIPVARGLVVALLASVLVYCLSTISDSLTYIKVLALAYPLVLYFFIFELELTSFLEVIPPAIQYKDDPGGRGRTGVMRLVQHCCLNNSEGVRSEAEFLVSHCSKRLTQVIYQSLVNVYYTTLIPCFFVPNSLHYDACWLTLHTLFVLVTCLLWHLIYCFPARFCDILHRSVQHLGIWSRVPCRQAGPVSLNASNSSIPVWQSGVIYSRGTVVRYGRDAYRAEAACNAAEPGNVTHCRLYTLFHEVHRALRYVFLLGLLCSVAYLSYLATLQQWQQVLATAILLAAHYAALYILLRDYLVLKTTYKQELLVSAQ